MTRPPRGNERAIAGVLVLLGFAALLVAGHGLRTGTLRPEQLPMPVLMACCAIYAGYMTLTFDRRKRAK